VKTDRLAVSGPYAHLRHPLYAGTFLAVIGHGAAAGGYAMLLVAAVFGPVFLLYYLPYKGRIEGARLERRHGKAFALWHRSVPAFPPRLSPWRPTGQEPRAPGTRWSADRFRANDEDGTLLAITAAWLLLALRGGLA
jgi:hypothetical protein